MLDGATAASKSAWLEPHSNFKTFTITGKTSSGTGVAHVKLYGTNDGDGSLAATDTTKIGQEIGEAYLSLSSTETGQSWADNDAWRYVRAEVVSISGTGAEVDVFIGVGR